MYESVTISTREYRELILNNAEHERLKPDPDTLGRIAPACKKLGCAVTDKFPCVPCAGCPSRAEGNQHEGGHAYPAYSEPGKIERFAAQNEAQQARIRQLEADLHQARGYTTCGNCFALLYVVEDAEGRLVTGTPPKKEEGNR